MSINYNRKLSMQGEDLILFESELIVKGTEKIGDITGPFYRLIFCNLIDGDTYWQQDNIEIRPSEKDYAIYIPPYSIVEDIHTDNHISIKMYLGKENLSIENSGPILFYPKTFPKNFKEIQDLLRSIDNSQNIMRSLHPNVIALRGKKEIEQTFKENISINDIAYGLNVSNSTLTQYFKKSFGITPVKYRRALRVEYAAFELMTGRPPAEVAFDCGYQDLGRFYKQFKAILKETPGKFQNKN